MMLISPHHVGVCRLRDIVNVSRISAVNNVEYLTYCVHVYVCVYMCVNDALPLYAMDCWELRKFYNKHEKLGLNLSNVRNN